MPYLENSKRFETFKEAYESGGGGLIAAGIDKEIVDNFLALREKIVLEYEAQKLAEEGIGIITFRDANYPKLLLEIPKFPPILYYRGRMDEAEELCIAVVGTRQITNYGRTVVPQLVEPIVDSGAVIVSGACLSQILKWPCYSSLEESGASNGRRRTQSDDSFRG